MGKTLAFTGHRPNKLNGYNPMDNYELLTILSKTIEEHIVKHDVDTFISGMALGIDMWSARIVLKLKQKYPHIKLICAIPCIGQYSKWNEESKFEWFQIKERADSVVYISEEEYTAWCLQKRNEWMVDNSDYIISVWDGTKGGTYNCLKYAKKKKCQNIVNIDPNSLEIARLLLENIG